MPPGVITTVKLQKRGFARIRPDRCGGAHAGRVVATYAQNVERGRLSCVAIGASASGRLLRS